MDVQRCDDQDTSASRLVLSELTSREAITFFTDWRPISLDGLSAPLSRWLDERIPGEARQRQYFADALIELQRLLDEVQFSTCLAHMLLRDFAVRHPDFGTHAPPAPAAMPVEALALLARHRAPSPAFLLTQDLHAELPGPRYMSRWLAGQLLDSALVRAVSALDRLAALVFLAVAAPENRRRGEWHAPILSKKDDLLKKVSGRYRNRQPWDALMALSGEDTICWLREHVRNAFIHRRRWPSALTSEAVAAYSYLNGNGDYVRDERDGLTAPQHLALVRLTWEEVLTPAVALVRQLFGESPDD